MSEQVLAQSGSATYRPTIDRALFRKMTWRIMPWLFLGWVMNWIDRINIGFAHLGFKDEFAISEAQFGVMVGVYAIGYLLLEVPSNMLMERIGARKTMSRIMLLWGLITVATGFAQNATQLIWMRALLGAAEAGFFPGVILYLSYWFPAAYRARVTARFILANAVSGMLGGPIAGWILSHMGNVGGLRAWQWLFILEGLPPMVLAVMLFFMLSDRPSEAKWLTDYEKASINAALEADRRIQQNIRHAGFWGALKDKRVYLLAIAFCLAIMVAGNVVNVWAPTILRGAGVTNIGNLGWLSALPYLVGVFFMFFVTRLSDARRERRWHFALPVLISAFGIAMLPQAANDATLAVLVLVVSTAGYLGGAYPNVCV
ncbi:MFS transporter [Burkholderia stagnalis]|uniref:MFS transporter n=1 Tax=Burkholderia stagnalis TaxID=1503054 RepID=UPI000F5A2552|nr:MFS transporter [Burkholderia stagnalis]RQQ04451.1 MFS transporter [Burkholderia stagnalis]